MRLADYDYDLPPARIAQVPAGPRDSARLLVDIHGETRHCTVHDLPDLVGEGDVVVVNETRVLPARLKLHKTTGGAAEVLLLEPLGDGGWMALVRPGRRLPAGTVLHKGLTPVIEVGEVDDSQGTRKVRLLVESLEGVGEVPLPPYITDALDDPERYQTVYARVPGSVAAPTAGLHLTDEVLERCRARGATTVTLDLAVGLATFSPITAQDPADHVMHEERYAVPQATLDACRRADRVIAVGTTTVRALESAARGSLSGRTALYVRPPFEFVVVDVLLTNFHMPRSSLLVLLDAFLGQDVDGRRWRRLYETAMADGYRFLSFGDAMLVDRGR